MDLGEKIKEVVAGLGTKVVKIFEPKDVCLAALKEGHVYVSPEFTHIPACDRVPKCPAEFCLRLEMGNQDSPQPE